MAKYLVETYYTCTFKVNHYLDDINEKELKNLEKRDDGKFEVLDVKLDNRKTKSLNPNEKNGALIKKEEIRKDDTKKITIYWYKLNKLTPGKANSIPFIINFFRV